MTGLPPPAGTPLPPPAEQPWQPPGQVPQRRKWPLWAKIAAPVGGLLVIGGIGNALGAGDEERSSIAPAADVTITLEPTTADPTTTTAPPATSPPTTNPPATATPTVPPTAPPTPAPTVPPATPAPTEPPPPPPTAAPAPPPAPVQPAADPRFGTCKEAKANGYGPYYRGDAEYPWYDDRDNDGVVCE